MQTKVGYWGIGLCSACQWPGMVWSGLGASSLLWIGQKQFGGEI